MLFGVPMLSSHSTAVSLLVSSRRKLLVKMPFNFKPVPVLPWSSNFELQSHWKSNWRFNWKSNWKLTKSLAGETSFYSRQKEITDLSRSWIINKPEDRLSYLFIKADVFKWNKLNKSSTSPVGSSLSLVICQPSSGLPLVCLTAVNRNVQFSFWLLCEIDLDRSNTCQRSGQSGLLLKWCRSPQLIVELAEDNLVSWDLNFSDKKVGLWRFMEASMREYRMCKKKLRRQMRWKERRLFGWSWCVSRMRAKKENVGEKEKLIVITNNYNE